MDNDRTISVLFTFSGGQDSAKTEEWLEFPATTEKLRQTLDRAGGVTAGCQMTPMFWENETASPVGGLTELALNEDSVNELNYLAAKLSELDDEDLAKFEAVIESGRYRGKAGVGAGELADYINIAENLDSFTFHPNLDEEGYGEYLLTGPDNKVSGLMRMLRNYHGQEGEELADYVECLSECVDAERFGRSMADNTDGEFLDSGYLIEDGGFSAEYYGVLDIPDKYRIWEPAGAFIKVVDVDLSALLLEMHALGGNYTQDAGSNYLTLLSGGDFFITENRGKLTVLPAAEVFCKTSPGNMDFLIAYEPDARAFFATVKESDGEGFWGSIHEIDINVMKGEVARLSYGAANIDAELKDGTNRLFTPAEWYALSDWQREQAAGMVYRYDPADEQKVDAFLGGLRETGEKGGRAVIPEDFLAGLNVSFMAKAQNQQPGMLRIAREAAKTMLARGDAEIYRLMPEGAVKLSPLDAVKSGGLWFKEHREFAIKTGVLAGLRKWANRTADDISRQAVRGERTKSHNNEL